MVNPWFSIGDERLLTFLSQIDKSLGENEIPYMFFGGIAHQVHIANALCSIYKANLEELTHLEGGLLNSLRATDNVDIAFGKLNTPEYMTEKSMLRKEEEEAKKRYAKAIKLVGFRHQKECEQKELIRKAEHERKIQQLDEMRKYDAIERIRSVFDSFKKAELESITGREIVTIEETRRGESKILYTLGAFGEQDLDKPLKVNLCYEPRDVVRNGYLKELDRKLYERFLERAQRVEICYTPRAGISLKVMRPEDMMITHVLLGDYQHEKEAFDLAQSLRKLGRGIDHKSIEEAFCADRLVSYGEEVVIITNPVLDGHYQRLKALMNMPN